MRIRLGKFTHQIHVMFLILCFLIVATALPGSGAANTYHVSDAPVRDYWPTEGWRNATPEETGLDSTNLVEMMDYIEEQQLEIDSLLVVHDGYLVLDEYPRYFQADMRHAIHSCTKSFASALVGIAIDQGYIESVNMTLSELFPSRTIGNMDDWKENVTLKHLLTMTPGLEWDEWSEPYGHSENDVTEMFQSSDCVQFVLDRPMAYEPGTEWVYNSGVSHLLTAIVADQTGEAPLDYVRENLFYPIGIENGDFYWTRDVDGYFNSGGGLSMTTHALAKFGYLYLNNGTWDGEQIVSADWVQASSQNQYTFGEVGGYGYQWWTYSLGGVDFYSAQGFAGQYIIVIPEYDMVIVFTSNCPAYEPRPHLNMVLQFIIDAYEPENSDESPQFDIFSISLGVSLVAPVIIGAVYHFSIDRRYPERDILSDQQVPSSMEVSD